MGAKSYRRTFRNTPTSHLNLYHHSQALLTAPVLDEAGKLPEKVVVSPFGEFR